MRPNARARGAHASPPGRGQIERGTEACDLPNRHVIDGHRHAALRGAVAPVKALAERLGAAVVLVSHATNGVFKACFRINAVATREGFGALDNGIGDLASAQSPVGRAQRWQRYQRLQGRCACNLC